MLKLAHRRRSEGKTNYRKRLKLLRSRQLRLVVRRSSNNIVCQIVNYEEKGDKTLFSADSRELKNFGWNYHGGNMPAAYLTGLLCGVRAKGKVSKAIPDLGLYAPIHSSRLFSAVKGSVDAGLDVPHSEDALPKEDRFSGKHISDYAGLLKKEKPTHYKKVFSAYLKNKLVPEEMTKTFQEAKKSILTQGAKPKAAKEGNTKRITEEVIEKKAKTKSNTKTAQENKE